MNPDIRNKKPVSSHLMMTKSEKHYILSTKNDNEYIKSGHLESTITVLFINLHNCKYKYVWSCLEKPRSVAKKAENLRYTNLSK
jgi:hypothetical protein